MFNKKIDKAIVGALVVTNILTASPAAKAESNDEAREREGVIISDVKQKEFGGIEEYYNTEEEANDRLEYLEKNAKVINPNIEKGTFTFTEKNSKQYVLDGTSLNEKLTQLKREIADDGGRFISYEVNRKEVIETNNIKKVDSLSKEFKGTSKEEVESKINSYIKDLEEKYESTDSKEYYVDVDYEIEPIYEVEPEDINEVINFDSNSSATQYVNQKQKQGYEVDYDIKKVDTTVDVDTEYVYQYDVDSAGGLLFDVDQAQVYAVGHPRHRADLVAQGYTLVDVSYEPNYNRWDTRTFDIVYTYAKPIVKTETKTQYQLTINSHKDGKISGYKSHANFDVESADIEKVIRDVITINSEKDITLDGYKLTASIILDLIDNNVIVPIDKKVPYLDIQKYFELIKEKIPNPEGPLLDTPPVDVPETPDTPSRGDHPDTPKTGDERNIALYAFLAGLSSLTYFALDPKVSEKIKEKGPTLKLKK